MVEYRSQEEGTGRLQVRVRGLVRQYQVEVSRVFGIQADGLSVFVYSSNHEYGISSLKDIPQTRWLLPTSSRAYSTRSPITARSQSTLLSPPSSRIPTRSPLNSTISLTRTLGVTRRWEHSTSRAKSTSLKDDERVDLEKEVVGKEIERESGKGVGKGESTLNPSEPVPSTPKETLSTRMKEADSAASPATTLSSASSSSPSSSSSTDVAASAAPGKKTLMSRLFPKDTSSASIRKLVELARPEKRSLTFAVGLVSTLTPFKTPLDSTQC